MNELRCAEQKLTKQNGMIRTPIADLGCEQAPPGCDIANTDESLAGGGGTGGSSTGIQFRIIGTVLHDRSYLLMCNNKLH